MLQSRLTEAIEKILCVWSLEFVATTACITVDSSSSLCESVSQHAEAHPRTRVELCVFNSILLPLFKCLKSDSTGRPTFLHKTVIYAGTHSYAENACLGFAILQIKIVHVLTRTVATLLCKMKTQRCCPLATLQEIQILACLLRLEPWSLRFSSR